LKLDVGNLLVFDYQEQPSGINVMEQARKSTQGLFELVFHLPFTSTNVGPIAKLPPPTTPIPREKPLPRPKKATRWEKFAIEKGIKKKKRSRKVWDETTQEWRPRWGKDRVNDINEKWVMEDKPQMLAKYGAEDPFHLEKIQKKERTEKNKIQQIKNLKRAANEDQASMPATLDVTKNAPRRQKYSLERAVALAQKSTASMGKFDKKVRDEPEMRIEKPKLVSSTSQSKIAERVLKKAESLTELNVDKAVRNVKKDEEHENRKRNVENPKLKGKLKRRRSK